MRELVNILEASLLVAGKPLSLNQIEGLFEHEDDRPDRDELRKALELLRESLTTRGIELVEVASGFRLQAKQDYAPWVANLMQERAPRYSRALLETLVLIAYRQPITRGEVEDVRGVAVSTNIIRTLLEREWIRVLGHKDVPGRPAIYGTTKQFLDYFNLKRIDELPTLSEIKDLDQIDPDLAKEVALLEAQELAEKEQAEQASDSDDEATDTDSDSSQQKHGEGADETPDAAVVAASQETAAETATAEESAALSDAETEENRLDVESDAAATDAQDEGSDSGPDSGPDLRLDEVSGASDDQGGHGGHAHSNDQHPTASERSDNAEDTEEDAMEQSQDDINSALEQLHADTGDSVTVH